MNSKIYLCEFGIIHVNLERKPTSQPSRDGKAGIGLAFIREGPNFVVKQLTVGGSAARSLRVWDLQLSIATINSN